MSYFYWKERAGGNLLLCRWAQATVLSLQWHWQPVWGVLCLAFKTVRSGSTTGPKWTPTPGSLSSTNSSSTVVLLRESPSQEMGLSYFRPLMTEHSMSSTWPWCDQPVLRPCSPAISYWTQTLSCTEEGLGTRISSLTWSLLTQQSQTSTNQWCWQCGTKSTY